MRTDQRRQGGVLAADQQAREEADNLTAEAEAHLTEEVPVPRVEGFRRMRFEWTPEDRRVIDNARQVIDAKIEAEFRDAFELMWQIYETVREPERGPDGEPKRDRWNMTIWRRNQFGYIEDWTKLTHKDMEHYVFVISTKLFDWRQRAADIWGGSMMAKAMFEERFSAGFNAAPTGTEGQRTANGKLDAREERYFALYQAWLSRRADAIVRDMEGISQRIKDVLTAG